MIYPCSLDFMLLFGQMWLASCFFSSILSARTRLKSVLLTKVKSNLLAMIFPPSESLVWFPLSPQRFSTGLAGGFEVFEMTADSILGTQRR